jgi:DNA polymerase elongation subunit (family B)
MAVINFSKMKKQELVWMSNHYCRHHNTYITHPNCYVTERPESQKVGVIDIESSQLRADWGITLCVAIADLKSDDVYARTITKKEVFSDTIDKELLKDVVAKMRTYDRLIGYYASNMRFDIPFLRTRCVFHDIPFPQYGEIIMEDLYPVIKNKFKLSSNRLANACEALLGESNKTHWLWKYWLRAIQGQQEALDYIEDHCIKDTQETKRLYMKVYNFNREVNASL